MIGPCQTGNFVFPYIYVSNETPNIDVFFDNLQVTHVRGPLLEETHYYPFGLTMAGISSKVFKSNYSSNKKGFVFQEFEEDLGIKSIFFKFRNLDPQTGRFLQVDPISEKYPFNSNYAYAENRPIDGIDLEGLEFFRTVGNIIRDPTNTGIYIGAYIAIKKAEYNESMNATGRLVTGTSEVPSTPGPPQIQNTQASLNKLNDINKASKPLVDALEITSNLASLTPIGEFGVATNTSKAIIRIISQDINLSIEGKAIKEAILLKPGYLESFKNSNFLMCEALDDIKVYRVFGGEAKEKGGFFGLVKPKTSGEAESLYYLEKYGNAGTDVTPVTIKKGTQFAIGGVEGGNGIQIYISIDMQKGKVIYFSQYSSALPKN